MSSAPGDPPTAALAAAASPGPVASSELSEVSELRAELEVTRLEVAELQASLGDIATLRLHLTREVGLAVRDADRRIRRRLARPVPAAPAVGDPSALGGDVPALLASARAHDVAVFDAVAQPVRRRYRGYETAAAALGRAVAAARGARGPRSARRPRR